MTNRDRAMAAAVAEEKLKQARRLISEANEVLLVRVQHGVKPIMMRGAAAMDALDTGLAALNILTVRIPT